MLRDITIGQYYPKKSIIHRLDPRVKLAGTFLYIISLFFIKNFLGYIPALIYITVALVLSGVPLRHILKGLKPVMLLIVLTGVINLFMTPGDDVLVTFLKLTITERGLKKAAFFVIRLLFLIISSSLLTYTTTPNQLTDGIEKAFKPLNKIKIPVHEFALIMSLALRFIPILVEEADKIIKAQSARGADFEEGKMLERIKSMASILVPLLVSAMRRADDLALAMDARCYHGGEGRTKMKPLLYMGRDYAGYAVICVYFVSSIIIGRFI